MLDESDDAPASGGFISARSQYIVDQKKKLGKNYNPSTDPLPLWEATLHASIARVRGHGHDREERVSEQEQGRAVICREHAGGDGDRCGGSSREAALPGRAFYREHSERDYLQWKGSDVG